MDDPRPTETTIHRLDAEHRNGYADMRRLSTACGVRLRNTRHGWMNGDRVYPVAHSGEVGAWLDGELSSQTGNYCAGCFGNPDPHRPPASPHPTRTYFYYRSEQHG